MTSPGIGGECGLTFGQTRSILQGLFIAPKTVNGALKGAVLCGKAFELLGYDVCPGPEDLRSDIIQAVKLGSPEAMVSILPGHPGSCTGGFTGHSTAVGYAWI